MHGGAAAGAPACGPLPLRERAGVWGGAPGGLLCWLLRARTGGVVACGAETGAGGGPAGPERARAAPADRLEPVKKL